MRVCSPTCEPSVCVFTLSAKCGTETLLSTRLGSNGVCVCAMSCAMSCVCVHCQYMPHKEVSSQASSL